MKSVTISMSQKAFVCDLFLAFSANRSVRGHAVTPGVAGDYFIWEIFEKDNDEAIAELRIHRQAPLADNRLSSVEAAAIATVFEENWKIFEQFTTAGFTVEEEMKNEE